MNTTPQFFVPTTGNWSGGGRAVLENFRSAAERHPQLSFARGELAIINRNFPSARPQGRFLLIPQNAWPWAGPRAGAKERAKLFAMRSASEVSMRIAQGVIRVSASIPNSGRCHPDFLANPLDPGFDEAVQGVRQSNPVTDEPYFVSIGSINTYRGIEQLLQGYALYRAEGGRTRLFVVGVGASPAYRQKISRQSNSMRGVSLLTEGLPRHQCLSMLHHARLAVLPSHVEASPFSLLEAMAVQSNVVASDIIGHRSIVPADTAHPKYFKHAQPEVLARLFLESESLGQRPVSHPLASPEFREEQRILWAKKLMSMLGDLANRST